MTTPARHPEVVDAVSLNKYLMGIATQIKTKEISNEDAESISKIADKIVKLNLVSLLYLKHKGSEASIEFFEGIESSLLIEKTSLSNGKAK